MKFTSYLTAAQHCARNGIPLSAIVRPAGSAQVWTIAS